MSIPSVELLDGTSIPWLAWGNGSAVKKSEDAIEQGRLAVLGGINHIDTAQLYKFEAEAAQAIKRAGSSKDQVYVTSKLSWDEEDKPLSLDQVRERVDGTLEKLGFIPDLFLIHNPHIASPGQLKEMWKILESLKDEGKLKSLGVSNFRPQDLKTVLDGAKHKPVVNQLEYHPYLLAHLEPLLQIQKEHGIVTQSYGTLTPLIRHPTGGPLKPILEQIAARVSEKAGKAVDASTILLLWARAQGAVVVTASANPQRVQGLGDVARLPQWLTEDEIGKINDVGKTIHFRNYTEHMEKDFPIPSLPSQ